MELVGREGRPVAPVFLVLAAVGILGKELNHFKRIDRRLPSYRVMIIMRRTLFNNN